MGEYFDKFLLETDPVLLARVVDAMIPLVSPPAQVLGGLELGGVPLATVLRQRTGLPVVFVRKAAKTYGTEKLVEGVPVESQTVVLVEDVVTSGGAVLQAARALRDLGAEVADCGGRDRPSGRWRAGAGGGRADSARGAHACGPRRWLTSTPLGSTPPPR